MRIVLRSIGALLAVIGVIWILQGINVLPGSFMTGQIQWAIYGGIALVAGIAMLIAFIAFLLCFELPRFEDMFETDEATQLSCDEQ